MKIFGALLWGSLGLACSFAAAAQSARGSLNVSATVLPSSTHLVAAIAPENAQRHVVSSMPGEHWIVRKSARDALRDYQAQMQKEGFVALDASSQKWSSGDLGVMFEATEVKSTQAIALLTIVAYKMR